jgi:hypothetical protein
MVITQSMVDRVAALIGVTAVLEMYLQHHLAKEIMA